MKNVMSKIAHIEHDVKLAKTFDALFSEYDKSIGAYNKEADKIKSLLSQLDASLKSLKSSNDELRVVYNNAEELWDKAVSIGIDDAVPDKITEIFDLGVSAGLGKIDSQINGLLTAIDKSANGWKHLN